VQFEPSFGNAQKQLNGMTEPNDSLNSKFCAQLSVAPMFGVERWPKCGCLTNISQDFTWFIIIMV
jgi:hypothetical protein